MLPTAGAVGYYLSPYGLGGGKPGSDLYFNRKLLVTTVTLDSAIAADASIGESSPSAATGMPLRALGRSAHP